jgi:hypothetical protein
MADKTRQTVDEPHDTNPDPFSGAAGAHPVGTGIGAASGAAAGATIGSVAGPIGAAVGTIVGAVAGGLAGKGAAEAVHPTDPGLGAHRGHLPVGGLAGAAAGSLAGEGVAPAVNAAVEDDYWRRNYATRPYVAPGATYDTYRAAYQFGWECYRRYRGRRFADIEGELRREWERTDREMTWESARGATRDAWQRVGERQRPVEEGGRR